MWTTKEGRKEMFYLTTHSTQSDIWQRTIQIAREETRCCHMDYSFRLTAKVLLYAPSHRQDNTYHGLCYTSHGALAGTRNRTTNDAKICSKPNIYVWNNIKKWHGYLLKIALTCSTVSRLWSRNSSMSPSGSFWGNKKLERAKMKHTMQWHTMLQHWLGILCVCVTNHQGNSNKIPCQWPSVSDETHTA